MSDTNIPATAGSRPVTSFLPTLEEAASWSEPVVAGFRQALGEVGDRSALARFRQLAEEAIVQTSRIQLLMAAGEGAAEAGHAMLALQRINGGLKELYGSYPALVREAPLLSAAFEQVVALGGGASSQVVADIMGSAVRARACATVEQAAASLASQFSGPMVTVLGRIVRMKEVSQAAKPGTIAEFQRLAAGATEAEVRFTVLRAAGAPAILQRPASRRLVELQAELDALAEAHGLGPALRRYQDCCDMAKVMQSLKEDPVITPSIERLRQQIRHLDALGGDAASDAAGHWMDPPAGPGETNEAYARYERFAAGNPGAEWVEGGGPAAEAARYRNYVRANGVEVDQGLSKALQDGRLAFDPKAGKCSGPGLADFEPLNPDGSIRAMPRRWNVAVQEPRTRPAYEARPSGTGTAASGNPAPNPARRSVDPFAEHLYEEVQEGPKLYRLSSEQWVRADGAFKGSRDAIRQAIGRFVTRYNAAGLPVSLDVGLSGDYQGLVARLLAARLRHQALGIWNAGPSALAQMQGICFEAHQDLARFQATHSRLFADPQSRTFLADPDFMADIPLSPGAKNTLAALAVAERPETFGGEVARQLMRIGREVDRNFGQPMGRARLAVFRNRVDRLPGIDGASRQEIKRLGEHAIRQATVLEDRMEAALPSEEIREAASNLAKTVRSYDGLLQRFGVADPHLRQLGSHLARGANAIKHRINSETERLLGHTDRMAFQGTETSPGQVMARSYAVYCKQHGQVFDSRVATTIRSGDSVFDARTGLVAPVRNAVPAGSTGGAAANGSGATVAPEPTRQQPVVGGMRAGAGPGGGPYGDGGRGGGGVPRRNRLNTALNDAMDTAAGWAQRTLPDLEQVGRESLGRFLASQGRAAPTDLDQVHAWEDREVTPRLENIARWKELRIQIHYEQVTTGMLRQAQAPADLIERMEAILADSETKLAQLGSVDPVVGGILGHGGGVTGLAAAEEEMAANPGLHLAARGLAYRFPDVFALQPGASYTYEAACAEFGMQPVPEVMEAINAGRAALLPSQNGAGAAPGGDGAVSRPGQPVPHPPHAGPGASPHGAGGRPTFGTGSTVPATVGRHTFGVPADGGEPLTSGAQAAREYLAYTELHDTMVDKDVFKALTRNQARFDVGNGKVSAAETDDTWRSEALTATGVPQAVRTTEQRNTASALRYRLGAADPAHDTVEAIRDGRASYDLAADTVTRRGLEPGSPNPFAPHSGPVAADASVVLEQQRMIQQYAIDTQLKGQVFSADVVAGLRDGVWLYDHASNRVLLPNGVDPLGIIRGRPSPLTENAQPIPVVDDAQGLLSQAERYNALAARPDGVAAMSLRRGNWVFDSETGKIIKGTRGRSEAVELLPTSQEPLGQVQIAQRDAMVRDYALDTFTGNRAFSSRVAASIRNGECDYDASTGTLEFKGTYMRRDGAVSAEGIPEAAVPGRRAGYGAQRYMALAADPHGQVSKGLEAGTLEFDPRTGTVGVPGTETRAEVLVRGQEDTFAGVRIEAERERMVQAYAVDSQSFDQVFNPAAAERIREGTWLYDARTGTMKFLTPPLPDSLDGIDTHDGSLLKNASAEQRLKSSAERYRALTRNHSDQVFDSIADGTNTFAPATGTVRGPDSKPLERPELRVADLDARLTRLDPDYVPPEGGWTRSRKSPAAGDMHAGGPSGSGGHDPLPDTLPAGRRIGPAGTLEDPAASGLRRPAAARGVGSGEVAMRVERAAFGAELMEGSAIFDLLGALAPMAGPLGWVVMGALMIKDLIESGAPAPDTQTGSTPQGAFWNPGGPLTQPLPPMPTGDSPGNILRVCGIGELNRALRLVADGPGQAYTIQFENDIAITGGRDLDTVTLRNGTSLTIDGQGFTLDGGGGHRGFLLFGGSTLVRNMTIANTVARGGDGGNGRYGGGGGAGLGGGLFVAANAALLTQDVTFVGTRAAGGNGGLASDDFGGGRGPGGGGGGMGGAGGSGAWGYASDRGAAIQGGGGGIGTGADGGSGSKGQNEVAGGGVGTVLDAPAVTSPLSGVDGGGGESFGWGGGIKPEAGKDGHDGTGGWGGGGGGGWGSSGLLGIGADIHPGGDGGFGGGGGGEGWNGGAGGWGGGGGGGSSPDGSVGGRGGFGAGSGGSGYYAKESLGGGGGLGAGGALFVQGYGQVMLSGGGQSGGTVAGGTAVQKGGDGQAYGSGIFLQGNSSVTLNAAMGDPLVIDGDIADEAGSHAFNAGTGVGSVIVLGANSAAPGGLQPAAGGTVRLNGSNSFTGGLWLLGNTTLELATARSAGSGAISMAGSTNGTLALDAAVDGLDNTIANWRPGSSVDLRGLGFGRGATALVDADGTGVVVDNGQGRSMRLKVSGLDGSAALVTADDGRGGTLVTLLNAVQPSSAPVLGGTTNGLTTFTGTARAGYAISLYGVLDAADPSQPAFLVGKTVAGADGTWSLTSMSVLAAGPQSVSAVAGNNGTPASASQVLRVTSDGLGSVSLADPPAGPVPVNGTVTLDGASAGEATVAFGPDVRSVVVTPAALDGTRLRPAFAGMRAGDTIVLQGVPFDGGTSVAAGSTVLRVGSGDRCVDLGFSGLDRSQGFTLGADGNGDAVLTLTQAGGTVPPGGVIAVTKADAPPPDGSLTLSAAAAGASGFVWFSPGVTEIVVDPASLDAKGNLPSRIGGMRVGGSVVLKGMRFGDGVLATARRDCVQVSDGARTVTVSLASVPDAAGLRLGANADGDSTLTMVALPDGVRNKGDGCAWIDRTVPPAGDAPGAPAAAVTDASGSIWFGGNVREIVVDPAAIQAGVLPGRFRRMAQGDRIVVNQMFGRDLQVTAQGDTVTLTGNGHTASLCIAGLSPTATLVWDGTGTGGARLTLASTIGVPAILGLLQPGVTLPSGAGRAGDLAGTGPAGATLVLEDVTLPAQPARLCSFQAGDDGTWSAGLAGKLAAGTHRLAVMSMDTAGNLSLPSQPVEVMVDPDGSLTQNGGGFTGGDIAALQLERAAAIKGSDTIQLARNVAGSTIDSMVGKAALTGSVASGTGDARPPTAHKAPLPLHAPEIINFLTVGDHSTEADPTKLVGQAQEGATVLVKDVQNPGAPVRLGTATAGSDGVWELDLKSLMPPGRHSLVAEVVSGTGSPLSGPSGAFDTKVDAAGDPVTYGGLSYCDAQQIAKFIVKNQVDAQAPPAVQQPPHTDLAQLAIR